MKICNIEGCGRKSEALGLCRSHYARLRYHGDPKAGRRRPGLAEKFFKEVVLAYEDDDCLIWPFNRTDKGYPRFSGAGGLVHRRLCAEVNGQPPSPNHDAAHSCGNGHLGCVTKRHLSWKTRAENIDDKRQHGTDPRGMRNPMAKLTDDEIIEIRALEGVYTQHAIAGMFGVSRSLISLIHARKTRSWLHSRATTNDSWRGKI